MDRDFEKNEISHVVERFPVVTSRHDAGEGGEGSEKDSEGTEHGGEGSEGGGNG